MSIPETCASAPPSMMRSQDTLQNENHTSSTSDEEIPSSPLYTSHLELNNNDGNSDDDLLDLNDFIPEATLPKPLQASHDECVTMKGAASPNQADGSGPNSSAEQASSSVPENNSNLPAQGSSGEPIQPPSTRATPHLRFRKKTLHLHFCKPTLQFSR